MSLQQLTIQNIRRLATVEMALSPSLNVIYGLNASGKTSLLEAIHLLSTGRSFRTSRFTECLSHEAKQAVVAATVHQPDGACRIGVQRSAREWLMKVGGERVQRVSELARWLPTQVIHPDSHFLLTAGPSYRRQFLNWGVFHVEHRFYPAWVRYQRALKQRNSALRQKDARMDGAWDSELSRAASFIHELREEYVADLNRILPRFVAAMMGQQEVQMVYQPGWDSEQTLATVLRDYREKDRYRGHTQQGPHRADLSFKVNGYKAQAEISRGQQKMLVSALRLAQAALYQEQSGQSCLIMMDDLPAELDEKHRNALMGLLADMQSQVLVTCVEAEQIPLNAWKEYKLFHVEHGKVQAVI
ncbi:DNA replication, recombinaison and repair protein [gamma proteobacterium HTCC5015]|nr:DNA replication, recombinaison and repair protein [gamma proteobacterium HTCC5015]